MSRNYYIYDSEIPHFITYGVVKWVDVLSRSMYKDIIVESLRYCHHNKGLRVQAWCIMSNHVHLIARSVNKHLSEILRDHKRFTSRSIIQAIQTNSRESRKKWMLEIFHSAGQANSNNSHYQFWQQHNQPIQLDTEMKFDRAMEYLHNNPVKARIVDEPHHYNYSSAIDYYGGEGQLQLEILP